MSDLITIDGSRGEGGGQVLRTAIGLSAATGQAVRVHNIRANRKKPGLARQHLAGVLAAARICGANVDGAALDSTDVSFRPGPVCPGDYRFDIGSAGSTSLVLQTVLPALLLADGPSRVTVTGGTHNPMAPPTPFLQHAFVPSLIRIGYRVNVTLAREGFHPRGGGVAELEVAPPGRPLARLDLTERGKIISKHARILLGSLPDDIARREIDVVKRTLDWRENECHIVPLPAAVGPANAVLLSVLCENASELFTALGERGKPAETVAAEAADECAVWLESGVPVGEHLADQLLIPLALAGGGRFRTTTPTPHTTTNAEVVETMTGVATRFEPVRDGVVDVVVGD